MLTRERNLESTLLAAVQDHFEKHSCTVLRIHHDLALDVIDLCIQLPAWADRSLRHDVLAALGEFERDVDHAVVISPTFVWATDAVDG